MQYLRGPNLIKKMVQGRFSSYANDVLKVGDVLETLSLEVSSCIILKGFRFCRFGEVQVTYSRDVKRCAHSEDDSRFSVLWKRNAASIIFREPSAQEQVHKPAYGSSHFQKRKLGRPFSRIDEQEKIEALTKSF